MSGTNRIIRLKPLRVAMRCALSPLTLGLAGLAWMHAGAFAAEADWDCRAGPDGRSWDCQARGQAVAPTPAAPAAAPLPSPADSIDAGTGGAAATPGGPAAPAADAGVVEPAAPTRPQATAPAGATSQQSALPAPGTEPRAAGAITAPAADQAAGRAFDDRDMPDLLAPADGEVPQHGQAAAATGAPPGSAPALAATAPFAGGIDDGIDWDSCQLPPGTTPARIPRQQGQDISVPVEVSAAGAVATLEPNQAVFSGDVQLVQGDLNIRADELIVNRDSGEVEARGDVMLRHPDLRIAGSAASYQLQTGRGHVEQASYRVPAIRARGEAERAELLGEGRSELTDISYTTCRPGDSDWLLKAQTLELDRVEGLGTATHANLRFLGVPILYVPTFTFPIDDRRRSGVLIPSIGQSDSNGFDLSVPYYLNLAENYDLTLTPRLMSKRGAMLGGEFRFLTETTYGILEADFLPDDGEYNGDNSARGSAALRSHTQFDARTAGDVRLNYVSDDDYLQDLGGSLAATSASHVERAGELSYQGDTWTLLGRAQYYQTIDDGIEPEDRPYSRMPQLLLDLENPDGLSGSTYYLDAEYVNFYRSDSVRGHRIDLFPAIGLPLRESWGFVEPKVGARYTAYQLTDQLPGLDDAPSTLTGIFSLDSGLYFDRSAQYMGAGATQTLEPRLFYLYVPHENQDDNPIFDTGEFDFNFDNLFRENRFNGADRFGDANQVTLAMTSRMIADDSGTELLRASVGQTIYFEDREVVLPGETVDTDTTSSLAAQVAAELGGGWRTRVGLQWDPNEGSNGNIDQSLAQISYRSSRDRVFNAAYRMRDGVTEQTDLAAIWPIGEQISLVGRHNYSLRENRLLEALAGIEYGRCCWRVRALLRQYANSDGDDNNLAFLLQLELNGLGRLGNDIEKTLERGIYGYRTDDDE